MAKYDKDNKKIPTREPVLMIRESPVLIILGDSRDPLLSIDTADVDSGTTTGGGSDSIMNEIVSDSFSEFEVIEEIYDLGFQDLEIGSSTDIAIKFLIAAMF